MNEKSILKLTFIGDVFPANLPYHNGFGVAGEFNKHFGKEWESDITKKFSESDFVIGNLESPLIYDSNSHLNSFSGSHSFAKYLKESGINVLSIANNHILEKGPEGFDSTMEILKKNGLKVIGIQENLGTKIEYIEKNNIVVGIAAFNDIHDNNYPNLYSVFSEKQILEALKEMKKADFKVLVFHWGNEYVNIPSYKQKQLAYTFIENGADIIIGHHPHVIQPVQRHKGGLIFYSLGNFLFDMIYAQNVRLGMCAEITLSKPKKIEYNVFPTYLSKNYSPSVFNFNLFKKKINKYTKQMELLESRGKTDYNKVYCRIKKRKHLWQRVLMKRDLLSSFFKVNRKEQVRILKHLWGKII